MDISFLNLKESWVMLFIYKYIFFGRLKVKSFVLKGFLGKGGCFFCLSFFCFSLSGLSFSRLVGVSLFHFQIILLFNILSLEKKKLITCWIEFKLSLTFSIRNLVLYPFFKIGFCSHYLYFHEKNSLCRHFCVFIFWILHWFFLIVLSPSE